MRNQMFLWNLNDQLDERYRTYDIGNLIRLRSDLHKSFDNKSFVLVPKRGIPTVHFLRQSPDYAKLFHNRTTEALVLSPSFLYARFGWAILGAVENFVSHDSIRIKVYDEATSEWKHSTVGRMRQTAVAAATPVHQKRKADPSPPSPRRLRPRRTADNTVNAFHKAGMSFPPLLHLSYRITNKRIVSANPTFAYDALAWYPGISYYNEMRERYLMQKEPDLHLRELKRQSKELAGAESDRD